MENEGFKTSRDIDIEIRATLSSLDIMEKEDVVESYKELASEAMIQSITLGCLITEISANYGEDEIDKHLERAINNANDVISYINGEEVSVGENKEKDRNLVISNEDLDSLGLPKLSSNEQIRSEVNEVLEAVNHGMSRETLLEKYKEIAGVAISESLFNECLDRAIEFHYGEEELKKLLLEADGYYEDNLALIKGNTSEKVLTPEEDAILDELFGDL